MVKLRFIAGPLVGRTIELRQGQRVQLGRSKKNDVQLKDGEVSRCHCELYFDGGKLCIRDLGSSNGTFVNGKGIDQARLANRSRVKVGSSIIEVAVEAPKSHPILGQVRLSCGICGKPVAQDEISCSPHHRGHKTVICQGCRQAPPPELRLEGFELKEPLGEDRFGMVYRAFHKFMEREVAVKVLQLRGLNDEGLERFLREARSAARLIHPNIVRVFDVGQVDDLFYLSMEFVPGETLAQRMNRHGPLSISDVVTIGADIASALQYAYEEGIVHRDVKPENIFLTHSGQAKLGDFGLAKDFEQSGVSGITSPGTSLGTLAYMPPEQMRNALVADQRSDIYALGATLYHALCGRPVFEKENVPMERFIVQIFREKPVPLGQVRRDVPSSLERAIGRALEKDPDDRFQTPYELQVALQDI